MRRENLPHYEDENLNNRNRHNVDDGNYQRGMNNADRDRSGDENDNPNNREGNFINDFMNNPKEAIAKEIIGRAEENLTKSWSDKFKCNFE